MPRRAAEDRERGPNEPVGKWRSNGEALEPKWRDGDSVPLLPFSHYRSYSRDDEVDDVEQDSPEAARRPLKYRYAVNQNRGRGRRLPLADEDDYEPTYRGRDYNDPDEDYPRKKRRPLKNPSDPMLLYEETIENAASNDGKRGRNTVSDSPKDGEKEDTSARYHEAFQAHPNEYEHEFSDEEYLRPRPRKRRPPQNYEFALANEASSKVNEEVTGTTQPPTHLKDQLITQLSDNARRSGNALELKSLLKMQQEEGSSLSEILQRRNLTLSDLLKGKADVINALKSRITDESDEYIEEMSRVMSNSLMKLAATVSPLWRSTQASTSTSEAITTKSATLSIPSDSVFKITVVSDNILTKSYDEVATNATSHAAKEEPQSAERMTQRQTAHDSSWPKLTTPPSLSITTSTSLPVVNSMEYFLNDDGNAGSTSDRGAKLENLDEDEIMEFSDFTDFKKAKSSMTPTWPSEKNAPQQSSARGTGEPRDFVSTLSIEQILNPTERIELTKDCGDQDDDVEESDDKETSQDNVQSISISGPSAEDYNAFLEAEYQNDAALHFGEDDGKRNTMKVDDNVNKSTANSETEKKRIADPAGEKDELHDKNHSSEYHRVSRPEKNDDRALENHRVESNNKRYEEVVSEIEPEARAEIFELFASGSAGKRLERLLKSRNMSVEELIALRQRGSSKVHLTEVSQLRGVAAESKNLQTSETFSPNNGEIVISLASAKGSNKPLNLADTKREDARGKDAEISTSRIKQDIVSYLHDPFFDKDAENTSMSRLLNLVERDRNASRKETFMDNEARNTNDDELEGSRRTVQIVDLLTTFGTVPFAKEVQRQFESNFGDDEERVLETRPTVSNDHANIVLINEEEETIVRSNNSANEFRAGYVEEITRENPNTVSIRTVYDDEIVSSANDESVVGEEKKTLSKVKPSIIASGAILGVTIVVFLAIFIVCRIRQKQKYIYRNTFSRAVFQGPVLAARKLSNSSSLSTVMVNVVATSTTKRPERMETQEAAEEFDGKSDMDNDSLDANDSWETIPDYAK